MGFVVMPTDLPISDKVGQALDLEGLDEAEEPLPETAPIMLKLTAQSCGVRLDKVLSLLVPQYSRSRIQHWIEAGHVTIDGHAARAKMTVLGDENIILRPQAAPEEQAYRPEPMALP